MTFTTHGLRDILTMGLSHGGEPNPEHPGLAAAIGDGYVISHLHDVGGVCEVWFGFDQSTGRKVAIKCARLSEMSAESAESLLRHEASVLAKLNGEAGLEPLGVSGSGLATYLALPWIDGRSIYEAVAADPDHAIRFVRAALNRLAAVHAEGYVHGDLKPAHVVVTGGGVVLLDFGLARSRDERACPSLAPRIAGKTPGFAPPSGPDDDPENVDARYDVWAMGAVLDTLTPRLSGTLAEAVKGVVTLSRRRDTQDAGALLACFDRAVQRRRRRHRTAAQAATLITVAVAGLSAGFAVWSHFAGSRAAMPQAVAESHARSLGAWSAGLVQLEAHPDRTTVLHRFDTLAVRGIAHSAGTIAWMLHNDAIAMWSAEHGSREVRLPVADRLYTMSWGESGELLVATRSGAVWEIADDAVQPAAQLDRNSARIAAVGGAIEGWSSRDARILRSGPNGSRVVDSGPVAATPLHGPATGWVIVDLARQVLLPGGVQSGVTLAEGEAITAAYGTAAGDVALGLTTGDILLSSASGPLRRCRALDQHAVTSICITPDGGTVLIGGPAVYAWDVGRGEVVAKRATVDGGPVYGLAIDASSGMLTVVSNRSAESWHLIDPDPLLASR